MRYVILGAGAVGCSMGGLLHQDGHEVVLVARGAHLRALQRDGLRLQRPDSDSVLPIPAVGSPSEASLNADDVVIVTTKTQDTLGALESLAAASDADTAVVCAQNGVENERLALRRFARVYGMSVSLPSTFIEPGLVQAVGVPRAGLLDVGRFPSGLDDVAVRLSEHLEQAGFSSRPDPAIMRWKYWKMRGNVANAVEALAGLEARKSAFCDRARDEAEAVFAAAGIDVVTGDEERAREDEVGLRMVPVAGVVRPGGSQWQSLLRGTGSVEADYVNGEIALLGRLHGVPTPANVVIQQAVARLAREGLAPGSVALGELERQVVAHESPA